MKVPFIVKKKRRKGATATRAVVPGVVPGKTRPSGRLSLGRSLLTGESRTPKGRGNRRLGLAGTSFGSRPSAGC